MVEFIAKNGALECSNACQPAHCCFSTEYSCGDTQLSDLNCDNYAECKVLYPKQKSVGDLLHLAEQIDESCSDALDSLVARSACQDQCKGHLCCFDDGGKFIVKALSEDSTSFGYTFMFLSRKIAYGCSNDASQNCLVYAGCEILVDTPQSALQNIDQGGVDANNAASKTDDLNPGIASTNQLTSSATESAYVDISIPSFSELNEVCNEKYMIANGVQSCKSLCVPYECKCA
jgi:hypothetical protein